MAIGLKSLVIGFVAYLCSSSLIAGDMGPIEKKEGYRLVGTLWGGLSSIRAKAERAQSFAGTDDNLFLYKAQNTSKTTGAFGIFLGAEHALTHPNFFIQAGLEYTNFLNGRASGESWVGIEPATSTFYRDHYTIRSQQALAIAKLFTTTTLPTTSHHRLYPYLSAGLGVAFNHSSNYSTFSPESGSLNVAPIFRSASHSSFSYSLGAGVDSPVSEHVRFGLGYRFASLGRASLGSGAVVVNQYASPVSFSLHTPNIYANQIIAHISYLS